MATDDTEITPAPPVPEPTEEPTPHIETRQEKLTRILEAPGFIDEICAHIANGGDYITIAQTKDLSFSDIYTWMNATAERGNKISSAEKMRHEWVRQRVLNELRCMALVDLREAYTPTGDVKKPEDWPENIARALSAVETEELWEGSGAEREQVGFTKKIKLHSKIDALKLIGTEFGLFVQKHKVEVTEKLEDLVADSFAEPAK